MIRTSTLALVVLPCCLFAAKFYDDDPLQKEPPPMAVKDATPRKLSDYYDLFSNIFKDLGENHPPGNPIVARDINTLGEVIDGPWYEKRHGRKRMSIAELQAGPGGGREPSKEGKWTIISAKSEGITPGFLIQDSKGDRYFIKFDPVSNPEMTTAADVVASKFFHALGYHVPENYIVQLDRSRLEIKQDASFRDARGRKRNLTPKDVGEILLRTPVDADGRRRATASRVIAGDLLHAFRYYGTRADDPNDTVPHEHRRSLRGLHVFCAWLGHDDSRAINTLDVLVNEGGRKYIKHYLIDFGSTLGSASTHANSPRSGYEQFFTWRSSAKEFFTLGLYVPAWSRVDYNYFPSVGRFTAEAFDPRRWTPEYPNPAFDNRLPEDTFWAARQVAAFTDEEIRAIVKTGQYSDPAAEAHVANTLIQRRDAIVRSYLSQPLAIDNVRVEKNQIAFDDWSVAKGFQSAPAYTFRWSAFNNQTGSSSPVEGSGRAIPRSDAPYLLLQISTQAASTANQAANAKPATDTKQSGRVSIYLKRAGSDYRVVGIEREWI